MRTCVARCRSVNTAHMGRVGVVTGWGGSDARESFARGSGRGMHGASKDWLRLGVGGAENADVSSGAILVGTAFAGGVVVATDGFVLRWACLSFCGGGRGKMEWIACGGGFRWGAHV